MSPKWKGQTNLATFPRRQAKPAWALFPFAQKKIASVASLGCQENAQPQRSPSSLPVGGLRVPGQQRQAGQGYERRASLVLVHLSVPKTILLFLEGSS